MRRQSSLVKMGVITMLPFIVWTELQLFSPATLPIPHGEAQISVAYRDMKTDPVAGAVLDLPLSLPNLERAVYVWNQSVHERPIPWGLNDPMPTPLRKNLVTQTLLQIEGRHAKTLPAVLPYLDLVVSARVMARQGYRYIVVHESFYPTFKLTQTQQLLQALFGEPKRYDDVTVYMIDVIE